MRETTTATTWWWTGGGSGEEKKLRGKIYRKWRRKNTTNEGRGREQRTEGIESTLRCRRSKSSGTRGGVDEGGRENNCHGKSRQRICFSVARAGGEGTRPAAWPWTIGLGWLCAVCLVAACVREDDFYRPARVSGCAPEEAANLASAAASQPDTGTGGWGRARGGSTQRPHLLGLNGRCQVRTVRWPCPPVAVSDSAFSSSPA